MKTQLMQRRRGRRRRKREERRERERESGSSSSKKVGGAAGPLFSVDLTEALNHLARGYAPASLQPALA